MKEHRTKQPRDNQACYYPLVTGADLSVRTDSEKLELLKKVREGDKVAIDKMIFSHILLALSITNRYKGTRGLNSYGHDLSSAAIVGVVTAVNQIAKGKMINHDNVTGYIVIYVRQFIADAINHYPTIYTPRRKNNEIVKPLSDSLSRRDSQSSIQELETWDLIDSLTDNETEKKILKLREEGYTDDEVGNLVGLSRSQVFRIRHDLFQRYQRRVKNG